MAKVKKTFLRESSATVKRTYEPCKIDVVLLNDDVLLASTYLTKGQYDDQGDWNPFKGNES